jgi:uncharacterized caspase-like protein
LKRLASRAWCREFTGLRKVASALSTVLAALLIAFVAMCPAAFAYSVEKLGDQGSRRLALVIGNSSYQNVPALKNAGNDAEGIANTLGALGFSVVLLKDAGLEQFRDAIKTLDAEAAGADAVVVYYSGHGFQLNGQNYLVPVDAVLTDRARIDTETLKLDDIIQSLDSTDRQTVILLDACRDNPLPAAMREKNGDGLAQVTRMSNTYVGFSTQPGNV